MGALYLKRLDERMAMTGLFYACFIDISSAIAFRQRESWALPSKRSSVASNG